MRRVAAAGFSFIAQKGVRAASTETAPTWISGLRDAVGPTTGLGERFSPVIFSEDGFYSRPFVFDSVTWDPHSMSQIVRNRLCLGDEKKEYTLIGEVFGVNSKSDCPIDIGTSRARLWWEHTSSTPKVLIQLNEHMPPLLWHSVKPTYDAVRRVFDELDSVATEHKARHLGEFEHKIEPPPAAKDNAQWEPPKLSPKEKHMVWARHRDPRKLQLDWPHDVTFFVGQIEKFRLIEEKMMRVNPFVHEWPSLLGEDNTCSEGTPMRASVFWSILSKSMMMYHTRLDLQLDHRQAKISEKDEAVSLLDVPLFVTANFPDNNRLCGGRALVERYNYVMGTHFPLNTPVDVIAALAREQTLKGTAELVKEIEFLRACSEKAPDVERVARLPQDMLAANRILGQLAYDIVYLALMGYDRFVEDVFQQFSTHECEMIRVACAKGAHAVLRNDLIKPMIEREEAGSRLRAMLEMCLGVAH